MKTAIYGRCSGIESPDQLLIPLKKIATHSELLIYEPFLLYLQEVAEFELPPAKAFDSPTDLDKTTDYILSVGGDGTFLEAAQFAVKYDIPILGINFGRLGFLAQVSANETETALDHLFAKQFEIEKRSMIEVCSISGDVYNPPALNEVSIQRNGATMLKTAIWIDGKLLSSYWSDGLLVATPTGSTAYSLSVGGPIVVPTARNFIITPIAPHNLGIRPAVVSDESEIIIEVQARKEGLTMSLDNTTFEIYPGARLLVRKSKSCLNFVKLPEYDFFKTLHSKLHWGMDARN